jgi:predicted GIY-YIG superfamily endonuclease
MWTVYSIWNNTTKQIYIGVNDFNERKNSHQSGKVKTTASWFANNHSVAFNRLPSSNFSTQQQASEYAHYVERNAVAEGFTIIETAGI